jgi:two-component system OmpR family sensor kinase
MWSLERRLRNHLLAVLTLLWLLGAGLGLYSQWVEMGEALDAAQEETAINLLRLPALLTRQDIVNALPEADTAHNQSVMSQVFTTDGHLIWRSNDAPDAPLAPLNTVGFDNEGDWRIVVRAGPRLNRVAVVATSLRDRREALTDGIQALFLPLLILLPLTAKGLTWMLRRTFVQLDALRQDLKSRDEVELEPLSTQGLPAEITPLVDEINSQFAQLKLARDAERSFAANSAHELRTPIAAAQAQLHRLTHEVEDLPHVDPDRQWALSQRLASVDRQLNKLQRLCVKLLQLSRAHSGVARVSAPIDLRQLALFVMEEFGSRVQEGRLTLESPEGLPVVMAMGDIDALGIALRNLIENALEHAGSQASVRVRITTLPSVDVIDDGMGVVPSELDKLKQPFQRGSSSAPGHGIGLAIVSAIADQMHGSLELISPYQDGRGLLARIRLRPLPAGSEGKGAHA